MVRTSAGSVAQIALPLVAGVDMSEGVVLKRKDQREERRGKQRKKKKEEEVVAREAK